MEDHLQSETLPWFCIAADGHWYDEEEEEEEELLEITASSAINFLLWVASFSSTEEFIHLLGAVQLISSEINTPPPQSSMCAELAVISYSNLAAINVGVVLFIRTNFAKTHNIL